MIECTLHDCICGVDIVNHCPLVCSVSVEREFGEGEGYSVVCLESTQSKSSTTTLCSIA